MKLLTFFYCLWLLISCGKPPEDEMLPELPNLGTYTATYMISEMPFDANNDGIYSTDFFEEFKSIDYHIRANCKLFRGSERTIIFDPSLVIHNKLPGYPKDLISTLISGPIAEYDPIAKKIVSETPVVYSDGSASDTRITYCELIDDKTVMVRFHHTLIYDIAQQKWITLQVEAMYKKVKLN